MSVAHNSHIYYDIPRKLELLFYPDKNARYVTFILELQLICRLCLLYTMSELLTPLGLLTSYGPF